MNPRMGAIMRRLLAQQMMQGGGGGEGGPMGMGEMDPSMSRMPPMGGPGGGGPEMEMDFPQGDQDYEAQAGRQARPQLVHSMPEMEKEYGGQITPSARGITQMYEKAPPGPIAERLHADQHGMIRQHKGTNVQLQRQILSQKKAQLSDRIRRMRLTGRGDEADRMLGALQKQGIVLDQELNVPLE